MPPAVREGIYPPAEPAESFTDHLRSLQAMLADLPETLSRRAADDATSAAKVAGAQVLPRLFTARTSTSRPGGI